MAGESLPVRVVRQFAVRFPAAYNWRNQHNVLVQRLRGGVHDHDFDVLAALDVAAPVVIDVGANTGQSVQTVKTFRPDAHIVSIEPSALVLKALIAFTQRFDDVEVAAFAVGEAFGTATIWTPRARGIFFTQWASLIEPDREQVAAALRNAGFGAMRGVDVGFHRARCVVAPLDEVVDACDVLKVDAEGYEASVFAGASRLIASSLPVIVMERPPAQVATSLDELGYRELARAGGENTTFVHPDRPRGLPLA